MKYIILYLYIVVSLVGLGIGLEEADYKQTGCGVKTRGEVLLPTYKLGCYLGETIDE